MISTALEMIAYYSAFHFRRQERVMAAVDYAGAAVHRREHVAFERWLEDLRRDHGASADPAVAHHLWERLSTWLHHHMLLQDVAVRPFLVDVESAERIAREGASLCLVGTRRPPPPRPRCDLGPYAASALVT